MILNGFFRCPCGKLHTYGGLTVTSNCPTCGRDLWTLAIAGLNSNSAREFHSIRDAARIIAREMFN